MITARIQRLLRELQCEPVTLWLCRILGVTEPSVVARAPGEGGDDDEAPVPEV